QHPLLGDLEFGDVGERADDAQYLAVAADNRARAEREPKIVAAFRTQAKLLNDAPPALLEDGVERHAESVAVAGVENFEPAGGGGLQRAAFQAEMLLGLGARIN